MSIFTQLLTGKDNQTHDIARWLALLWGLGLVVFTGWDTIVNRVNFNAQNYGIGCGAIAAGVGGLIKMKEGSEP